MYRPVKPVGAKRRKTPGIFPNKRHHCADVNRVCFPLLSRVLVLIANILPTQITTHPQKSCGKTPQQPDTPASFHYKPPRDTHSLSRRLTTFHRKTLSTTQPKPDNLPCCQAPLTSAPELCNKCFLINTPVLHCLVTTSAKPPRAPYRVRRRSGTAPQQPSRPASAAGVEFQSPASRSARRTTIIEEPERRKCSTSFTAQSPPLITTLPAESPPASCFSPIPQRLFNRSQMASRSFCYLNEQGFRAMGQPRQVNESTRSRHDRPSAGLCRSPSLAGTSPQQRGLLPGRGTPTPSPPSHRFGRSRRCGGCRRLRRPDAGRRRWGIGR